MSRVSRFLARIPGIRRLASAGSERPDTSQILRTNGFLGPAPGPWRSFIMNQAAEWLGPYTPDLVPAWVLKRMRSDPQIKLGLNALRSPLFGITYDVTGGTPATRALVRKTLLDTPLFHPLLRSILNALDFGFQSHELLWKLQDVTIDEDGPGGMPPETIQLAAILAGFVDIDPETVLPIVNERGELVSIRVSSVGNSLVGATGAFEIPAAKVLHAVHEMEWRDWCGSAKLRPAYNPWYWCNYLYLYKMRYAETRIVPPLVTYAPFEARDDEDKGTDQKPRNAMDVIAEQAAALRNGSVASLPDERDEKGNQRFTIAPMQGDAGRIEQFNLAINHMQALKLRALCIPERAFTQDTETGSFAMVKEHVDAFLMSLEGDKRDTVIPALNFVSERITRANYKSDPAPVFVASELARAKQEQMFELIKLAINVPVTLEDGRVYTPAQLINFQAAFRSINTPIHKPEDVARKPAPLIPPKPGPIEVQGDDSGDQDQGDGENDGAPEDGDGSPDQGSPSSDGSAEGQEPVAAPAGQTIVINIPPAQVEVQAAAAPQVHVQASAAPQVHVQAAQAAQIHVAPTPSAPIQNVVNVEPTPIQNVIQRAEAPVSKIRIDRDAQGRIAGGEIKTEE